MDREDANVQSSMPEARKKITGLFVQSIAPMVHFSHTCVSVTVAVLGARGLVRVMVYKITLV